MTVNRNSVMKRGDLAPPLEVGLLDGSTPVDVSTASEIKFLLKLPDGTVVSRLVAERPADGVVTLNWEAGDTAAAGTIRGEVQITWPGNEPQTFPANGTFRIDVQNDLG